MPLSKRQNRDRMRVLRSALGDSGATQVQPNIVQPKQNKIRELRDMMEEISLEQPSLPSFPLSYAAEYVEDDDWIDAGITDEELSDKSFIDIDADGNLIPELEGGG